MRLDQLRYLSDLQYSHSISKTAKRYFISQQSLSNNIQQLEKELDVILLERLPLRCRPHQRSGSAPANQ